MSSETQEQKISQIIEMMDSVLNDNSVPKNIRKAVNDAKEKLKTVDDVIVRTSGAVYLLDSVSEDINMPMHARTQIWTIVSALETVKEE